MNSGKAIRMRRFFKHKHTVIVPMDHPMYSGPVSGLEDPFKLIRLVSHTEADGILASPWAVSRAGDALGQLAFVARLDGGNSSLGTRVDQALNVNSIEQVVKLGADMVAINIFVGGENEPEMLLKLGETAEACEAWGMPLLAEMIPAAALEHHYGKGEKPQRESGAVDPVSVVARIGAEYGGDMIKTIYSGDPVAFAETVRNATIPVLVAGGPKTGSDRELLAMVKACIDAGAAGITIGRNVWQRSRVEGMIAALCAIVHDEAGVDEAEKLL